MHALSELLTEVINLAPAWAVYLVVALVLFSETAILICGMIVPSEATLIAAGVAAAIGKPNIVVLIAIAVGAALAGDLIGYWVGTRSGPRIQESWAGRKFGEDHWRHAETRVRENVFVTVPIGRWLGYVRTLVPITAGMSAVSLRRYAVATFFGGATWATSVLLLAYLLGATAGARLIGIMVVALVAAGVLIVVVRWVCHRIVMRRRGPAPNALPATESV
ncbi:hypothetical protein GOHSU_24_00480 [Gordonia hirsuta DSM 44140 = NBRC 16056]|uniref:VTT domain-containing protein n=1 Tax=Gordonia hirsuta DSM 44140 = NBRC 16056 TaxID=1121927 RepID=L7LA04_9ACTN|nr:DedA family protein [Gordonia hirsuta]GAC57759.1 hypothetical protein GOHSU_24_00480 [Gordonia hirsuta DSM 44140 = NBRC 16056]